MKLKTLLMILALVMTIIIGSFSALAAASLGSLGSSLKDNSEKAAKYARLLNETRAAQVSFQRQVQEWKDSLIRGNDKELYDKHWKAFSTQEKNMNDSLASMQSKMQELSLDTAPVDKLSKEHEILGKKYREAFATFDPAVMTSGQAVDVLVRGMDRPTSAALTNLADGIEKNATAALNDAVETGARESQESLRNFFAISAAAVAATLALCLAIGRSVLRKVGAEPTDLAESFAHIAKGDLSQALPVKEGDEASLAASAAMMQMRMKMMVRSIQNGANELGEAADKAGLSSSMEEVKTALRSARAAVKGLSDAANRFKI